MSVHTDSPTGKQYHVRYKIDFKSGPQERWSYVYTDLELAQEVAESYRDRAYDVRIFTRDVSPWREAA